MLRGRTRGARVRPFIIDAETEVEAMAAAAALPELQMWQSTLKELKHRLTSLEVEKLARDAENAAQAKLLLEKDALIESLRHELALARSQALIAAPVTSPVDTIGPQGSDGQALPFDADHTMSATTALSPCAASVGNDDATALSVRILCVPSFQHAPCFVGFLKPPACSLRCALRPAGGCSSGCCHWDVFICCRQNLPS